MTRTKEVVRLVHRAMPLRRDLRVRQSALHARALADRVTKVVTTLQRLRRPGQATLGGGPLEDLSVSDETKKDYARRLARLLAYAEQKELGLGEPAEEDKALTQ